jgi:hypothetical protein
LKPDTAFITFITKHPNVLFFNNPVFHVEIRKEHMQ